MSQSMSEWMAALTLVSWPSWHGARQRKACMPSSIQLIHCYCSDSCPYKGNSRFRRCVRQSAKAPKEHSYIVNQEFGNLHPGKVPSCVKFCPLHDVLVSAIGKTQGRT